MKFSELVPAFFLCALTLSPGGADALERTSPKPVEDEGRNLRVRPSVIDEKKCYEENLAAAFNGKDDNAWPPKDIKAWMHFFEVYRPAEANPPVVATRQVPAVEVKMDPDEVSLLYSRMPGPREPVGQWAEAKNAIDQYAPGYRYIGTFEDYLGSGAKFSIIESPDGTRFSIPNSFAENVSKKPPGQLLKVCAQATEAVRSRLKEENLAARTVELGRDSDSWSLIKMADVLKSKLSWFEENRGHAHLDVFPVEEISPNLFRYAMVTTVKEGNVVREYNDTVVLPGERKYVYAALVGVDHAQQEFRMAARGGPPVNYGIASDVTYQPAFELAGVATPADLPKRLADGKERQVKNLLRFLSVVYPDYVKERGWSQSTMIDLYRHSLATANSTSFVLISENGARVGQPPVIGALGLSVAGYGKVRFFNQVTQQWTEVTGSSDGRLQMDYPELYSDPENPRKPENWSTPVPILGMENVKDHPETRYRPEVLTHVVYPSPDSPPPGLASLGPGMVPDLSRGIFYYAGEIGEPTKLWLVQDRSHPLRETAKYWAWEFLAKMEFQDYRSVDFNLNGRRDYTYNPQDEWPKLYGWRGFEKIPSTPSIMIDGKPWDWLWIAHPGVREVQAQGNRAMVRKALDNFVNSKKSKNDVKNVNAP